MQRLRESTRVGGRPSRVVDRVCVPLVGKLTGTARVGPAYGEDTVDVMLTTI